MLRLATEIVRGAYEEAMRKHGILPGTITVINAYAEANLAALDDEPNAPDGGP